MSLYSDTVTRLRPAEHTTRGGDTVPDWTAAPDRLDIGGVNVQPSPPPTEQAGADRDLTVRRLRVLTDRGVDVDVQATDRIEYRGDLFAVDGDVDRWRDSSSPGAVHHVEFTIVRAEG